MILTFNYLTAIPTIATWFNLLTTGVIIYLQEQIKVAVKRRLKLK